jgi:hypothetical protein
MNNEQPEPIKVWDWILDQWPNATQDDIFVIAESLKIYAEGLEEEEDDQ